MVNWNLILIQWGGTFLISFIFAVIIASLIFLWIHRKIVKKAKIEAPKIVKGGNENKNGFSKKEEQGQDQSSGRGGGRREGSSGRERSSGREYLTKSTQEYNYGSGATTGSRNGSDKDTTGQGRRVSVQPPDFDSGSDTSNSGIERRSSTSEGGTKNKQPDFK